MKEHRYYLLKYQGEAFAVYDREVAPNGICVDSFPIPFVFHSITEPEYGTYKEFGMYEVKPGDSSSKLMLVAEYNE